MDIIGLTGAQKHGKTTLANIVHELDPDSVHLESSTIIAQVADAMHVVMPEPAESGNIAWMNMWLANLPSVLKDVVHVDTTFDQLKIRKEQVYEEPVEFQKLFEYTNKLSQNPELAKQPITTENKSNYRDILQFFGSYIVSRVDNGVWYNEIVRVVSQAEHDGATLAVIGGLRYPKDAEILREAGATIADIYRPGMPILDANDPTERERSKIVYDTRINNDGTEDDLRALAPVIIKDIMQGTLQKFYAAAP